MTETTQSPTSAVENRFTHLLATRPWLLADGATGSNLFDVGLMSGDAPELWNTEHPDRIAALHQSFVDAGADILLTNSFGGTVYRLKLHNAQSRMAELNTLAAQIARQVADASGRTIAVAGSMGPTGEIMEPIGPLTFDQAKAAFAEQALALKAGGADVLWIETMSSREEVEAAVAGAGLAGLPIVCTLSFDTNGRTMMGISPSDFSAIEKNLVTALGRVRHQLWRRRFRSGGLHPQPGAVHGAAGGTGCQRQLRRTPICGRCHLLQRHARDHGPVCAHGARCGSPHHRRLLRYLGQTFARNAPSLRSAYARPRTHAGGDQCAFG